MTTSVYWWERRGREWDKGFRHWMKRENFWRRELRVYHYDAAAGYLTPDGYPMTWIDPGVLESPAQVIEKPPAFKGELFPELFPAFRRRKRPIKREKVTPWA